MVTFPKIRPANRPYVRAASAILCIVIGVAVSGIARIGLPSSISTSSSLRDLPPLVALYLNLAWVGSAVVTATGILWGRRNVEAAGYVLTSSAWSSYYVAILTFNTKTALSTAYVLGFAVGAALYAYYITSSKYEVLIVRKANTDAGRRP